MRKQILILIIIFSSIGQMLGQEKQFRFFYITKDYTTQVTPLCSFLEKRYEQGLRNNREYIYSNIFYLANGDTPIIVRQNVNGDNAEDFEKIISALITKSETRIYPQIDVPQILNIFNENDVITESGKKLYDRCELYFLVTPTFWNLQYNEKIFAALYFALELDADWANEYVDINIYHDADDGLESNPKHPFGTLYASMKYNFELQPYE